MKKFSRVLILPAALLVANASGKCPLDAMKCKDLDKNKFVIGATILADQNFGKKDHAKKAFMGAIGRACDSNKAPQDPSRAQDFMHGLVIDYGIRRLSAAIDLDGYVDAAIKKCDVLPESMGIVRDVVNEGLRGTVKLVTHPETLTLLVMNHALPAIVGVSQKKDNPQDKS